MTCSAPKGVLTPEIKAELQHRKPEILAFLKSLPPGGGNPPPIEPLGRRDNLPVSFAQRRLWFLDQMEPGNPVYNIACALRLTGSLDRDALEKSLREILRRHEALRTRFRDRDGIPVAFVDPIFEWRMPFQSLTGTPAETLEQELHSLMRREIRRPFDLNRGPLLRATLFELGPNEHALALPVHHVAFDGWSAGVFLKELCQLYPAFKAGAASPLEEPKIQYADYADWQRRWLDSGVLEAQLPFWKQQLRPPTPVLELPTDRPRPAVQSNRGQRIACSISRELMSGLKEFSREESVTLFMTLLAGFKILLLRYTSQQDVIVGTAVANRSRPELEGQIGFFVNNLALRTDLSGNPSVRECIARVRKTALDGFGHQDVPFDRLVEVLRPERSLNRSPIFQTMFILHNWPFEDLELPDLRISRLELDLGTSRFDLSAEGIEMSDGFRIEYEFNTDLFDPKSVRRLHRHYEMLLTSMVRSPDANVGELPMLSPAETAQLLRDWNDTAAPYPLNSCVHDLIDQQAAANPNAEAVRFEAASLSYGELIRRANQLANYLQRLGVRRDALVGICLERSHEMIVALLAVWKAGGAYVPLDPAYPRDRLAFMAEDSGMVALLTEEALLPVIESVGCPVVCLDRDREALVKESEFAPESNARPQDLAYVIYTSGSTGKPKGVLIEHRTVVNFLHSMRNEPGMTVSDTLLSVTTLSFDIAGLELFLPLTVGARVVLTNRETASDGVRLAAVLETSGATVMQATPATWRILLEAGWRGTAGLKILCGGEAMPRNLADALLATGAELWNLYGPTETTIWSTAHRVQAGEDPVPIGRPIANTSIYILDAHGAPVPANVAGELCIGGAGLARGYHERPELTADRFVPDPFASAPGARMYRTGDLARYRATGIIEYLGRLDHQVKVRGFRIELGEIESALVAHERVEHAVVEAREDTPGDQRLVAYLIGHPSDGLNSATLRSWLAGLLPAYMVPSAFVFLDAFPLTPNGKVDRRALPPPQEQSEPRGSFSAPGNEVENTVAEIWRAILRVDTVGTSDNFFDLGGHSLLVIQVQSRLRERFQCDIPLIELFRRPTVSAIAAYLVSQADAESNAEPVRDLTSKQEIAVGNE